MQKTPLDQVELGYHIDVIQRAVAAYYRINPKDIMTKSRYPAPEAILPRQVAIYLSRNLTSGTFLELGKQLGVSHAWMQKAANKIKVLCEESKEYAEDIRCITQELSPILRATIRKQETEPILRATTKKHDLKLFLGSEKNNALRAAYAETGRHGLNIPVHPDKIMLDVLGSETAQEVSRYFHGQYVHIPLVMRKAFKTPPPPKPQLRTTFSSCVRDGICMPKPANLDQILNDPDYLWD